MAASGLSRLGVDVGDRGRLVTGVASQILYSGLLGAAYAVLREETRGSRSGRILVEGALTYAASLVFPDRPRPVMRGPARALRSKAADRMYPAAAFSRVTAMTLGAMAR